MLSDHSKTIVVVSIPLAGHSTPVLKIAHQLTNRGHDVFYISSGWSLDKIKDSYPKLKKIGLEDSVGELLNDPNSNPQKILDFKEWDGHLRREIEQLNPSLIIADALTMPAIIVAQQLGIRLVCNLPGPLQLLDIFGIPNFRRSYTLGGWTVFPVSLKNAIMSIFMRNMIQPLRHLSQSVVLVNSFYGIDEARTCPPNFKLTGPLRGSTPPSQPFPEDISLWLEKIRRNKKDVVYVTFGSMLVLSEDFIANFYEGLKLTDFAVLWSLKKGKLPEDNENMLVRPWLPQAELLKLPEVKVVVTHCGWGGVLECIEARKPVLTVPEFGDQPDNSKRLVELMAGLSLYKNKKGPLIPTSVVVSGIHFSPKDLRDKLVELATNPIYKESMERLYHLSQETAGLSGACDSIESVMKYGHEHLVDKDIVKISSSKGIFGVIGSLLIVGWAILYLWKTFRDSPSAPL